MENLRKIRKRKGENQERLAIEIGVEQVSISSYELGKVKPSIEILLKLAEYYHCSTDYLLDLTNIKPPVNELVAKTVNKEEAELLASFRELSIKDQNKVIGFIRALKSE